MPIINCFVLVMSLVMTGLGVYRNV